MLMLPREVSCWDRGGAQTLFESGQQYFLSSRKLELGLWDSAWGSLDDSTFFFFSRKLELGLKDSVSGIRTNPPLQ